MTVPPILLSNPDYAAIAQAAQTPKTTSSFMDPISAIGNFLGNIGGGFLNLKTSENQLGISRDNNAANLQLSKDQLTAKQLELVAQRESAARQQQTVLTLVFVILLLGLVGAGVYLKKKKS